MKRLLVEIGIPALLGLLIGKLLAIFSSSPAEFGYLMILSFIPITGFYMFLWGPIVNWLLNVPKKPSK